MNLSEYPEVICQENKTLFLGPNSGQNSFAMIMKLVFMINGTTAKIYILDPLDRIKTIFQSRTNHYNILFKGNHTMVSKIQDLPRAMYDSILLIDDDRGYYSFVEEEDRFSTFPTHILCTVGVSRAIKTL